MTLQKARHRLCRKNVRNGPSVSFGTNFPCSYKVSFENETFWREHTETLIKQGHFLCLAMLKKSDMIWKSCIFNLNKGTLKFLLNSCLDTLPTQINLLQWEKSASDLCKLYLQAGAELQGRRQETTNHILKAARLHYTKTDILGGTTILLNISLD